MKTLVDHLERTLGPICSGFSSDTGEALPFQIALFEAIPTLDAHALSTLGLSNHRLDMGDGRTVRQELVMLFRPADGPRNLPAVMCDLGEAAIARHRAYLQGEVIGPRGPLFDGGSRYEALYVALPVYLPHELALFEPRGADPVVIAWLVPITHGEAHVVQRRGWRFFEALLAEHQPDLLAPDREGLDVLLRE